MNKIARIVLYYFCWNNYLQRFLIFNSWNDRHILSLRSVSNWPITVALVDVSLTTQKQSCYFTPPSHIMCQKVSEAAILSIETIFNILCFRWKRKRDLLIYISQNVSPGILPRPRVSIFIIDHRPPRVSYLALTRSGLKCGSWYLWQLSKIDFQNLVVKRSMKVSIEENHRPKGYSVYWFREMDISSQRRWWTYVCKYVSVPIFVLAEWV